MASDLAGADAMIAVAEETGRILTVHQNLRYAADFVKVREVIATGVLGRIIEIRIHNGRFDRRWDWQTFHALWWRHAQQQRPPLRRHGHAPDRRPQTGSILPHGDHPSLRRRRR